jgi:NAD(P)-dependent dehydrogenase (short-subunit alcohol dehydrogenase family)
MPKMSLKVVGILGAAYVCHRLYTARVRRYDFRDRTVVITGGARGLGLVMARQLAEQGARVAICSRHDEEIQRAVEDLRSFQVPLFGERCDVTDPAQVDDFLTRVRQELGSIDVLINNAGVIQVGPLDEMTTNDFHEAMRIHFHAPLHAMQSVIPEMRPVDMVESSILPRSAVRSPFRICCLTVRANLRLWACRKGIGPNFSRTAFTSRRPVPA